MKETNKAFIAGFLDADGSIYVRLKPNKSYRFGFQVAPYIVFFQKNDKVRILEHIKNLLMVGYLRERKDGIIEYTIGDISSIRKVIRTVLPYIVLKKEQAELMLKILSFKGKIKSGKDFLKLAKMIDRFGEINYSTKRSVNSQKVKSYLKKEKLL